MKSGLTIIIPAYNVEKYLKKCLDSLVNQSSKDFKVIIVNDGSSDKTEEICLEYVNKYKNIFKYIYQDNKGLGGARNTGLANVETSYISFVDSDDWLDIHYVEKINESLKQVEEEPDIIFTLPKPFDSVTNFYYEWKDSKLLKNIFTDPSNSNYLIPTNVRKTPQLYDLEVNACRKIYRVNFLKKLNFSFPEQLKWEDIPGHFYLIHEANTCIGVCDTGFYYRTNQGDNICAGTGESRLDIIPIFKQLLQITKKSNFTEEENIHVLRLIVDFTNWFIEETNQDYIDKLLSELHTLYLTLDNQMIKSYLTKLSKNPIYEEGLINALKSDEYLLLGDYFTKEQIISKYSPIVSVKPKGRMRRAMECVADHGVTYSIILVIRKIKKRLLKQYKVVNGEIIYE